MKKNNIIIAIFLITILICCVGSFFKQKIKHVSSIIDEEFIELSATEIHRLPERLEENALTCTGLSYDEVNQSLWVGNYGATSSDSLSKFPSIIELDYKNYKVKQILELPFLNIATANIQGVAYDADNDSIWFTDSSRIYQISKNGELLSYFSVEPYSDSIPNGVACDKDGSLWVLFYKDYLINYTKDGKVISVINCNYENQDQIVCDKNGKIWISAGADYLGDKNYVLQINSTTGQIVTGVKAIESYAIEGITFIDGKLLVLNDGLYHEAKIESNYLCIYELK